MSDHQQIKLNFGKHNGTLITRVPLGYLKWMVQTGTLQAKDACKELDRRGVPLEEQKIEISGHAMDRASTKCMATYVKCRKDKEEGLWTWLNRVSLEALAQGALVANNPQVRRYLGLKFVFELDLVWPVLKTVMPQKD